MGRRDAEPGTVVAEDGWPDRWGGVSRLGLARPGGRGGPYISVDSEEVVTTALVLSSVETMADVGRGCWASCRWSSRAQPGSRPFPPSARPGDALRDRLRPFIVDVPPTRGGARRLCPSSPSSERLRVEAMFPRGDLVRTRSFKGSRCFAVGIARDVTVPEESKEKAGTDE